MVEKNPDDRRTDEGPGTQDGSCSRNDDVDSKNPGNRQTSRESESSTPSVTHEPKSKTVLKVSISSPEIRDRPGIDSPDPNSPKDLLVAEVDPKAKTDIEKSYDERLQSGTFEKNGEPAPVLQVFSKDMVQVNTEFQDYVDEIYLVEQSEADAKIDAGLREQSPEHARPCRKSRSRRRYE